MWLGTIPMSDRFQQRILPGYHTASQRITAPRQHRTGVPNKAEFKNHRKRFLFYESLLCVDLNDRFFPGPSTTFGQLRRGDVVVCVLWRTLGHSKCAPIMAYGLEVVFGALGNIVCKFV
jgi:hypothetical protein